MSENTYNFDIPKHHKSIIKVIGIGGGGSNAVNHMYKQGIRDVEFVVCNTDVQALKSSPVPNKLQIGVSLTEGLGAGANPERGRNAAIESKDEIRDLLVDDTKMVFITAGMGGGTGTGAAPIIAKVAKDLEILTVGIVTVPFAFEGKKKMNLARQGVAELQDCCDTVLVILNDKLREIHGNLAITDAFAQADNVLTTAAKGIAEIITVPGYVNVDFEDVRTVMKDAGAAVMGSATAEGDNRARRAAENALASPLLNTREIHGAQKILLSIISGPEAELQMDELTEITDYIHEMAGDDAEVIFGHGVDPALENNIRVTVITTGFDSDNSNTIETYDNTRTVFDLESTKQIGLFSGEDESDDKKNPSSVPFSIEGGANGSDKTDNSDDSKKSDEEESSVEEEFAKGHFFDFDKEVVRNDGYEDGTEEDDQNEEEDGLFSISADDDDFEKEESRSKLDHLDDNGMVSFKSKRNELRKKAEERVQKLKEIRGHELSDDELKEKLDVPAYLRKKVNLSNVPHSSERNISKFNLNDDNQILGNNKFLHDNVD